MASNITFPIESSPDMLEEKNRILAAVQNEHDSQMNKLRVELEKQRNELTDAKLNLQDEERMSSSLRDELNSLKSNRNEASFETNNLRKEVDEKESEIKRLQMELSRRDSEGVQARASQEEFRIMNDHELQKSKEIIEDLKKKLSSFMSTIDAKNTELMNLQTVLGQYYAEIEAKEHLESDLSLAKEECSKLLLLLQTSLRESTAYIMKTFSNG